MSSQSRSTMTPPPLVPKPNSFVRTTNNLIQHLSPQATPLPQAAPLPLATPLPRTTPQPLTTPASLSKPSTSQQIPIPTVALATDHQMTAGKIIEKIEVKIEQNHENASTASTSSAILSPKPGTSSGFKSATVPLGETLSNVSFLNFVVHCSTPVTPWSHSILLLSDS